MSAPGPELYEIESALHRKGLALICGVDEAGRGPLVGPVAAGAVILPEGLIIEGLNDSKKLSEKKRETLYEIITGEAVCWSVGFASAQEIDEMIGLPTTALVKGDSKAACISAASIIAKVTRDRLLRELDARYPGYGFAKHKGYGTAAHYEAILRLGLTPEHRRSFLKKLPASLRT